MLLIVILIVDLYIYLNEKLTPCILAENWANKELMWQDRMAGLSEKQIMRNVESGKYIITPSQKEVR